MKEGQHAQGNFECNQPGSAGRAGAHGTWRRNHSGRRAFSRPLDWASGVARRWTHGGATDRRHSAVVRAGFVCDTAGDDGRGEAATLGPQVLRADGLTVAQLIDGILPLFELDSYATPLAMMAVVEGDTLDPEVEADYRAVIDRKSTRL